MAVKMEMKHGRSYTARIAGAGLYVIVSSQRGVPVGYVQTESVGSNGLMWSAKPAGSYKEGAAEVKRLLGEGW